MKEELIARAPQTLALDQGQYPKPLTEMAVLLILRNPSQEEVRFCFHRMEKDSTTCTKVSLRTNYRQTRRQKNRSSTFEEGETVRGE